MLVQGNSNYTKQAKISSMLEAVRDISAIESPESPKVLNTHLPYKWLPRKHKENGGKIIHITRNPKDAYVSNYYHMLNLLVLGATTRDMTWTQYFDTYVMEKGTFFQKQNDITKFKIIDDFAYSERSFFSRRFRSNLL